MPAGENNTGVDMTTTEIYARAIRKLDRNSSPVTSGEEDVSKEAPE